MPTDTTTTLYAALIGGCSAAFIGGFTTILSNWLKNRSEERRHLQEIAMKTALENWKQHREWSKAVADKTGHGTPVAALDIYIIHMLKIVELVATKRITAKNVNLELSKIQEIVNASVAAPAITTNKR